MLPGKFCKQVVQFNETVDAQTPPAVQQKPALHNWQPAYPAL
jgi:hypothetical protein